MASLLRRLCEAASHDCGDDCITRMRCTSILHRANPCMFSDFNPVFAGCHLPNAESLPAASLRLRNASRFTSPASLPGSSFARTTAL